MKKIHLENERRKRKYFEWLRNAKGLSPNTIKAVVKAILEWEDFTDMADFKNFNEDTAILFKEGLLKRKNEHTGKTLALSTCLHYINALFDFFMWLSQQSGYKSKLSADKIAYLKLDKKQTRMALEPPAVKYPSLDQVKAVTAAIKIENEVDLRDRALMAFTLLSGMRVEAVMTLPLGCVSIENAEISQDPKQGVRTKFSKRITTILFNFDPVLLSYVNDWIEFLTTKKLFSPQQPLFPITKLEQKSENDLAFVGDRVHPQFWQTTNCIRDIFRKRFSQACIEYFAPHSFRHLAVRLAVSRCSNPEELKAVSQNFGHEFVATTMMTYGTIREDQASEIVRRMDFSENARVQQSDIDGVISTLQKLKNKF